MTKSPSVSAVTSGGVRAHESELVALADLEVDDAFNVRRLVDEARVMELAGELARHGQLSPLVVLRRSPEGRPVDARSLFLVAGFRRHRAMTRLGWTHARAVVLPPETTLTAAYLINIAENAHEPLHPSDIARRVVVLRAEHRMTSEAIAAEVGHSDRYLRTLHRLATKLPEALRQAWYARHPLATLETLGELVHRVDAVERWEQHVLDHQAVHDSLCGGELLGETAPNRARKRPTDRQVKLAHRALRELPAAKLDAEGWKRLALQCLAWMHTGQGAPEDVLGPLPRRVGRPSGRDAHASDEGRHDGASEGERAELDGSSESS